MYDIIIIGAGPAGLSAAIYGARAMKKVLVLDGNNYGGQIINSSMVENYPGVLSTDGFNFVTTLYNQAKNFGAEFISQNVQEMLDNNTVNINMDFFVEEDGLYERLSENFYERAYSDEELEEVLDYAGLVVLETEDFY